MNCSQIGNGGAHRHIITVPRHRWSPSAPCSLTERMHLHEYVQRKFADATRKRRVHDRDNFVREYERPPPAASTPGLGPPTPHLAGAVCPSPHYRLARPLTGWPG